MFLNGTDVNGSGEAGQHIQYSGLDQFPGVWQINVLIPQTVTPSAQTGNNTLLNLIVNGTANIDLGLGWKTVIWVK